MQNPDRYRENRRRAGIKARYGITLDEYNEIIAKGCAICGETEGRMALDHDHSSGRIRDCLCMACNIGLGAFTDDTERMRKAIEYLESHRSD